MRTVKKKEVLITGWDALVSRLLAPSRSQDCYADGKARGQIAYQVKLVSRKLFLGV